MGNRRRDLLVGAAFLLPNLALLLVFTYRPLINNIRLSFTSWNVSSPTADWVGVANYVEWFTSADSQTVLWDTVIFTGAAVLGSMALGLGLALLLDQKLLGRNAVRSLVFAQFVLAGAAVGWPSSSSSTPPSAWSRTCWRGSGSLPRPSTRTRTGPCSW